MIIVVVDSIYMRTDILGETRACRNLNVSKQIYIKEAAKSAKLCFAELSFKEH